MIIEKQIEVNNRRNVMSKNVKLEKEAFIEFLRKYKVRYKV